MAVGATLELNHSCLLRRHPPNPILPHSLLGTLPRALSQASVYGMNAEGLGTLICPLVPMLSTRLLSFWKADDCAVCLDGQRAGV